LDKTPSEPRQTIELRASKEVKQAAAPETLQDRINAAMQGPGRTTAAAAGPTTTTGGAAAAAGVLTAVDEDEEGVEDAPVPEEFDYHSDGEME
jgi:26S proteasome regulatory subunit N2